MLHDAARHEPLTEQPWDADRAQLTIGSILNAIDDHFSEQDCWPWHPLDLEAGDDPTQPAFPMYHGAAGVIWVRRHLAALAQIDTSRYERFLPELLDRNRGWLAQLPQQARSSFMAGDTPILMMMRPVMMQTGGDASLAALIDDNRNNPARELMWGAPGTMLAALLLHERTGGSVWSTLYRESAATLREQLQWSEQYRCHYWTQDLYGRTSTYLDAIHGFAGTAAVLIKGRHLLADWNEWCDIIVETVLRTASREADMANWRPQLLARADEPPTLMQFCHGSPGFVICLADLPDTRLDEILLQAGEAVWRAGPLRKGSNLCHGTGGNGYAFLKLYKKTGNRQWLERARAFAMHGIDQFRRARREYGQLRYSLWTGDPGFAVYLNDCIHEQARFPTLDVF